MNLVLPPKLGLLDSGVGGFSVLNALLPVLPPEVVYIADAAYLPYGQKSAEFLLGRATALTHFFESQGITTIFIACHTLSATVITTLQEQFPHITYIDLLPLTITRALATTKNHHIGVMATPTTIATHVHQKLIATYATTTVTTVIEQACPDFVPLIEKKASPAECMPAIKAYLTPLLEAQVDTIILGCTHYPFIQDLLQEQAPHIFFVTAANALPPFALQKIEIPHIHFVTTASEEYMRSAVEHYLKKELTYQLTFESRAINDPILVHKACEERLT